jgi:hypothetical protein
LQTGTCIIALGPAALPPPRRVIPRCFGPPRSIIQTCQAAPEAARVLDAELGDPLTIALLLRPVHRR